MWECKRCKYLVTDDSVGHNECENDFITESKLEKHYTGREPNCPHFQERRDNDLWHWE